MLAAPDRLALRAGITNVTDEEPPFVNGGGIFGEYTDPATYRLLGRTYALNMQYRFH